jgi:hypothetical protein
VGGVLRIAHCGGLHVPLLNKLVDALNLVAKLLHRRIRWDTETAGCDPSLSSIPTMEQRLLTEALQVRRLGAPPILGGSLVLSLLNTDCQRHPGVLVQPLASNPHQQQTRSNAQDRGSNKSLAAGTVLLPGLLQEVRDWMDDPANEEEFLVLYFDDQPDLGTWVSSSRALVQCRAACLAVCRSSMDARLVLLWHVLAASLPTSGKA